jgi:DNA-binding NarL/FixJ family response regulator
MTRILIADDHAIVRSGIRGVLSDQPGWEIVGEAENGKQAVDLAAEVRPDIAVLDYQLPLMNGIDATRAIRVCSPKTEVLIFTMHESEFLLRDLLDAGARGYLLKSDAERFLIMAIEALERHKPFFTDSVSEVLLEAYMTKSGYATQPLTTRERSVIQLIAEGHGNKKVAEILGISLKTVEAHRSTAMRKINATSTPALVRYTIRHKLIEP